MESNADCQAAISLWKSALGAITRTLSHSWLVHANRRVARFIDEAAQKEAVFGISGWVGHAVAAQPPDEENDWHLAAALVWPSDEGPELFATLVSVPFVLNGHMLEILTTWIGLR